jgi:hypothetical protein
MNEDKKQLFGGKPHKLTKEDRIKGGKTVTLKRILSARLNSMKSGKYATKAIKVCSLCKVTAVCPYRVKSNEPCRLFSTRMIYSIMKSKGFATIEEFDLYISDFLDSYMKTYSKDPEVSALAGQKFLIMMLELQEAMSR